MDEKIILLIADYCAGTISREDASVLRDWVNESGENRQQFEEYLSVHRAGMEGKLLRELDENKAWRRLSAKLPDKKAPRNKRLRVGISAAAAIAVIAVSMAGYRAGWFSGDGQQITAGVPGGTKATLQLTGGGTFELDGNTTLDISDAGNIILRQDSASSVLMAADAAANGISNLHTIDVPRGGEFNMTLPDGSRIWLNSETRMRFPSRFDGNSREIHLEGEAYLIVERNAESPFIVRTPYGSVNVLGTTFNVAAYPQDRAMVTSLLSGSVEVDIADRKTILSPGRQAVWKEGWQQVEVRETDATQAAAWVEGRFEFEDLSLQEILSYLSRWYGLDFEFADAEIAELRFTGGARKYAPVDDFLNVIEKSCDISFIRKGPAVRVTWARNR